MNLRKSARDIMIINLRIVLALLFDKKYFCGRWFENSRMGWIWLLRAIWFQKILGFNRSAPVAINPSSKVSNWDNLEFHPDNLDNFQSGGCYFQNYSAKIFLGRGVYIAPNVGIITANHDPKDVSKVMAGDDVSIGEGSWLGMNSIVLPGVQLGPNTTVAAGAVVTKSFPNGNCILAGVPAKIVRSLS